MNIVEQVRAAGIVGAGGAGFPTHVKLKGHAQVVVANGAECEPLLRVDQLLIKRRAERVVRGMALAMEATGASRGVIATKAHYHEAVQALEAALQGQSSISLHLLESYYPSGDEKSLIFEVTGQVPPTGKLPLDVGCVVCNVATLANVAEAAEGKPVVEKDVTIGGDVPSPLTVTVPIGMPIRTLLPLSGFNGTQAEYALIIGGPCMGRLEEDWDAPITKTTGGLLVFKRSHPLIRRRSLTPERQRRLARAVCCQCSYCTQLCPRHAMGLDVEPHKAMRALTTGSGALLGGVLGCSGCGLCTNYACPMGLAPSEVMAALKGELGKAGIRPQPEAHITADPFVAYKRTPVKRLIARMGLTAYDQPAPYATPSLTPQRVSLPLRQHVGKAAQPVVRVGDSVRRGQLIGEIPEGALGARLHASIDGTVTAISPAAIDISRGGRS